MNKKDGGSVSSRSLTSSESTLSSGSLLQTNRDQERLIEKLRMENKHLVDTIESMEADLGNLEAQLCKFQKGQKPQQDEEDEEWLQMHSHCTSKTCWRQKYAESLMQLRAALVEVKNELEKQSVARQPSEPGFKHPDIRIIEESLRSIGPIRPLAPPPSRLNLKRPSDLTGIHEYKMPRLTPSESKSSIVRQPFFKRVINIFRRNNSVSSMNS